MIISFATDQLRADSISFKRLVQKYGAEKGKRIRQRLDELDSAQNFADFCALPATHWRLVNAKDGLVAVDTVPPAYMLFKMDSRQPSPFDDGQFNWQQVTSLEIINLNAAHD